RVTRLQARVQGRDGSPETRQRTQGGSAMSINHSITTGDWVRATAKNGAVIEGQAVHNLGMSGYPVLEIALHDDSGKRVDVRINVNFWDVYVIRPNLLQKAAE